MSDYDLRVISLGAGVQSSTMYRMSALGELPKADLAIFADTQQEPPWVYDQLSRLHRDHGHVIPIKVASAGDLGEAVRLMTLDRGARFASIPFWTRGDIDGKAAPSKRNCTRDYKIDVVKKAIRERLGLKKGERAAGRVLVQEWVGISLDEAHRAKPSRYSWLKTHWPLLLDVPMRREDCLRWHEKRGFPIPRKSACVFCPYRHDKEYARWRTEEPELFARAVEIDEAIRASGPTRGMRNFQYVSRSLVPLRELPEPEEIEDDQLDLFGNECEGMCGV